MKTIKASEFKAKCLKIMDDVAATGEPVTITKHGVAITQLVPATHRPVSLVGALQGTVTVLGDIVSPVETEWEALQ